MRGAVLRARKPSSKIRAQTKVGGYFDYDKNKK